MKHMGELIPAEMLARVRVDRDIEPMDSQSLVLQLRFQVVQIGFDDIFDRGVVCDHANHQLILFCSDVHLDIAQKLGFKSNLHFTAPLKGSQADLFYDLIHHRGLKGVGNRYFHPGQNWR